jgi:hypothetical protein
MLTPLVWAIDAPGDAKSADTVTDACALVDVGSRVCLPTYALAVEVLIALGADPAWAAYCELKARRQPPQPGRSSAPHTSGDDNEERATPTTGSAER